MKYFLKTLLAITLLLGIHPIFAQSFQEMDCNQETALEHQGGGVATSIRFLNAHSSKILIFWINPNGEQIQYASLKQGEAYLQQTYTTHYWIAKSITGECLGIYLNSKASSHTALVKKVKQKDSNVLPPKPTQDPNHQPITKPPFHGTIFLDQDIIVDSDPNAYVDISPAGQGERTMFDRRVDKFIQLKPFLFTARYSDGLTVEVQVNPEFGTTALAMPYAKKYARAIGFLPTELRKDVQTMWIHKGDKLFGGGNNNILIHTEQAVKYEKDGILEETLMHEASHTSLDAYHAKASAWKAAQKADRVAISTYAKDNPEREDVAETYLLYFALRYRPSRIDDSLKKTIQATIPNRIQYFDQQNFKLFPVVRP